MFFNRNAVDFQYTAAHLDDVARQADGALDIVYPVGHRRFKNHHIARFGLARQYSPRYQRQGKRHAVSGVSIWPFRHEQIVADQQPRLHGFRWNVERRNDEAAQYENEQRKFKQKFAVVAPFRRCTLGFSVHLR